jgi:hypothetical protein
VPAINGTTGAEGDCVVVRLGYFGDGFPAGTGVAKCHHRLQRDGLGHEGCDAWTYLASPAAGTYQFKLDSFIHYNDSGTGNTCYLQAGTDEPIELLVEDCGGVSS